jgi:hypothetical protein
MDDVQHDVHVRYILGGGQGLSWAVELGGGGEREKVHTQFNTVQAVCIVQICTSVGIERVNKFNYLS